MEKIDTGLAKAPAKIHFSAVALGKKIDKTHIKILQYAPVGSYLSGQTLNGDEVLYKFGRCPPADVARFAPKHVRNLLSRFNYLGPSIQEPIHERLYLGDQAICFFYCEVSCRHCRLTHKAGRLV